MPRDNDKTIIKKKVKIGLNQVNYSDKLANKEFCEAGEVSSFFMVIAIFLLHFVMNIRQKINNAINLL